MELVEPPAETKEATPAIGLHADNATSRTADPKPIAVKAASAVAGVFIGFIVICCGCAGLASFVSEEDGSSTRADVAEREPPAEPPPESAAVAPPPSTPASGITRENFGRLKMGMSYGQVVAILGEEGELAVEAGDGEHAVKNYTWESESFFAIKVISLGFTNDRLDAKSQIGL